MKIASAGSEDFGFRTKLTGIWIRRGSSFDGVGRVIYVGRGLLRHHEGPAVIAGLAGLVGLAMAPLVTG